MKRLFFLIVFVIISLSAFAQDSTETRTFRNEFGIDATPFVKQFFNFNTSQFQSSYDPLYYLTYRRFFSCGNLRAAMGGSFDTHQIADNITPDSIKYYYRSTSMSFRIGWEWQNRLGRRWEVFYGMDFRPAISHTKNDAQYWNGGYSNGYENRNEIYGIAPLMGFRFRINRRLSLSTETSLAFNCEISSSRRYFMPISAQYAPIPDDVVPKTKDYVTRFGQPVFLFIAFKI